MLLSQHGNSKDITASNCTLFQVRELQRLYGSDALAGWPGSLPFLRCGESHLSGKGQSVQMLRQAPTPEVLAQGWNYIRRFAFRFGQVAHRDLADCQRQERH